MLTTQGNASVHINPNQRSVGPIENLKKIRDQHVIWNSPLLKCCQEGVLDFYDFQYVFSQYYLYSKNFSRLLAAMMVNCENDFYRSKIAENLWEESGEKELEKRHAEIFRKFLKNHLKISNLEKIIFDRSTEEFVHQYLDLCLSSSALESSAALSLGTEGIVAELYTILRAGLLKAGFSNESLLFFNIHIECDDDHAETLEEILISYIHEHDWFDRAKRAMMRALDLRNIFFDRLYQGILRNRLDRLSVSISSSPKILPVYNVTDLKQSIGFTDKTLYHNSDKETGIEFTVMRMSFPADVLNPRLVTIPVGACNEYHRHAHETIFLILEGEGMVTIGQDKIPVHSGDLVFVPRWLQHQTTNTGEKELRFFAVTDYGLTRRIPTNNETGYRLKQENVQAEI